MNMKIVLALSLSDPFKACPPSDSINDFNIDVLDGCLDPLEARLIDNLNPDLNRRHERTVTYFLHTCRDARPRERSCVFIS